MGDTISPEWRNHYERRERELEARIAALERAMPAAVLDLIYKDPHSWSTRPCPTCRTITAIIGQPFGCNRYQAEQAV